MILPLLIPRRAVIYLESWERLSQGGPIRISYLPDDPLTNRVEDETDLGAAAAQILMGGLLAIGGGALLFWDTRRILRSRRLLRAG